MYYSQRRFKNDRGAAVPEFEAMAMPMMAEAMAEPMIENINFDAPMMDDMAEDMVIDEAPMGGAEPAA